MWSKPHVAVTLCTGHQKYSPEGPDNGMKRLKWIQYAVSLLKTFFEIWSVNQVEGILCLKDDYTDGNRMKYSKMATKLWGLSL